MFIEIDDMLINLDNVTGIHNFGKKFIRICFLAERDYIDIKKESEEELNKVWEWLRGVCLRKAGEQE